LPSLLKFSYHPTLAPMFLCLLPGFPFAQRIVSVFVPVMIRTVDRRRQTA
jgi:hypothetical protein